MVFYGIQMALLCHTNANRLFRWHLNATCGTEMLVVAMQRRFTLTPFQAVLDLGLPGASNS